MHHFVVKFSKIFFASGGKGALTPANRNRADVRALVQTDLQSVVDEEQCGGERGDGN